MEVIKKKYLRCILSILSLAVFLPVSVSASTTYLKGQFDVNGGQVDYQLPIQVAPGRAGHAPSLQLAYSSDNPNGILGVGWQLHGLSSIYRCGKNLAIDGNWGGVNLDSNDQYCIDGKRLIAITGKPGENATEYRTRTNDYRKIVSFGRQGSGPQYFKAWSKDGQVYEYGVSGDSRAALPGKKDVYKWSLNKIFDITRKNTINFGYIEDSNNGSHRIDLITYSGGTVKFNYENRNDTQFSYLAGSKINKNHRIKSIVSNTAKGDEVASYKLAYYYSTGTSRTLLKHIQQCANGVCSKPVKFAWQSQASPSFSANKKIFDQSIKNAKFYDLERDGNLEIFTLRKDKKSVVQNSDYKTKASGWNHVYSNAKGADCHDFAIADWHANDKPIFRAFCSGSASASFLAYPNGNGRYSEFYTANVNGYGWAKKDKYPTDKNGDGKYTLEPLCDNCSYIDINGDGQTNEYLKIANGRLDYYKSGRVVQNVYKGEYQLLKVADFNNDGYQDLLTGSNNKSYSGFSRPANKQGKLKVYYFNGHSFVANISDFNVDYNEKITTQSTTCGAGNSGSSTCTRYHYSFKPFGVEIVDTNSDGFNDIVYYNKVYINKGGVFNSSIDSVYSLLGNKTTSVEIIDVNSDGWPDNLSEGDIKRSKAFAQDKIKTIYEHGLSYDITYAPLTSDVHQQKKYYDYPIANSTPTKYVVSKYVAKPQGYSEVKTEFEYYGAKSHWKGEGFLGFERIDRTRSGTNTEKTVTTFEQVDPLLAGKVSERLTYRNKKLYVKKNYRYSKKQFSGVGAKYYSLFLDGKTEILYDDKNRIEKKTVTSLTYDAFGNVLTKEEKITSGIAGAGDFTTNSVSEYLSTGTNKTSTVIDVTGSVSASVLNKYDSFQLMCSSNGTKYIKPTDQFVLIHGDISIPLITKRYNEYYKLVIHSTTNSNGVSVITKADFVPVTEAVFKSANSTSCGNYVVMDHNGDGKLDLTSVSKTVTQLITESGDNYWKVSAPFKTTQKIKDNSKGFNRVTVTTFGYTSNGLIDSQVVKPEQYEQGDTTYGNTSKQISTSYTYDRYGNLLTEQVSGTGVAARTTTTQYDAADLFPLYTTNAKGHQTRYNSYDARFGLVKEIVSPVKGRTTLLNYDGFGRVLNENPPGSKDNTAYVYRLGSACPESTSKTVSCVITKTANGAGGVYQTVNHYDYAGREIRAMHQAFDGRWVYRDSQWDSDGRKVAVTRPSFKRPDTRVNPVPTVTFSYDERDREISKTEPAATGKAATFVTRYNGLTTTLFDAKGEKKTITYNVLGHITATTEPMGASQTYINYPDGKLKETKDSAGNIIRIRYDNLGYRTYLDDPNMGGWSYDYNVFGELTEKTDANGVTTRINYDNLGRKIAEKQSNQTSTWVYDTKVEGLLSYFAGNGNKRDFRYNSKGQVDEIVITAKGQRLATRYTYDGLERVASEVRPNGLKLEHLYNPYGYHAAVRSPKDFADNVLNSPSFRDDIQKLIDDALAQAQSYLNKAEEYAVKESFFEQKAGDYASRELDLHNLDSQSIQLLKDANRYKKYCAANGECYLQAATWVLLHDDVTIPLDIDLKQYFKISSHHTGAAPGRMVFDSTVHKVSAQEFNSRGFTKGEEWLLRDYDRNGTLDLINRDDVYTASVDSTTQQALIYTSEDLTLAAQIAATRYQYYYQLADQLTSLAEQVGDLAGLYCDDANRLAGDNLTQRNSCANGQQVSQVDHLQTVLTQTELGKAAGDQRYVYYWQRQSTDAYDHTLAETLGNGLVNSYIHNQQTGRPNAIATHLASSVVSQRNHLNMKAGQNIRYLRYNYDAHNNVTRRDDLELGISESFEYDALDRLAASVPMLDRANRHGQNNPDFNRRFDYDYDALGNLKSKTDIGSYEYTGPGPHMVSKANGITFTYDKVGNLLKGETGTTKKVVERSLEWSSFNKPTKITRNGHTVEFAYDANHSRYYRKDSSGKETLYFDKLYEQVKDINSGEIEHKQFIYADGKLIALNIEQHDSAKKIKDRQIRYLHYDALESVDLITDGYGLIVERRSFDPWGKQRKLLWRDKNNASSLQQFTLTNRGYTGHEHLKEVGLIHMNGRVYDQDLGRFLSADPIIQSPYMTNSFNRYSYVTNNPLKFTDPTGFVHVEGAGAGDGLGRTSVDLGGEKDTRRGDNRARNGRSRNDGRTLIEGSFVKDFTILANNLFGWLTGYQLSEDELDYSNWRSMSRYTVGLSYVGFQQIKHITSTYMKLSAGVYDVNYTGVDGYTGSVTALRSGLQYGVFMNAMGHTIVAFAGTQVQDMGDLATDGLQAFGLSTAQYRQAISIAKQQYRMASGNITFTGHSLGGGLATASAMVTGAGARVFNAAGVHENTIAGYERLGWSVTNYNSTFDVIQGLNAITPASTRGETVSLGSAGIHVMSGVCGSVSISC
ncbi:RHS repeat-associated core domain-containing protein [Photobacterium sp.]|uniref:RHS repeat-associated core domain-containing protein n=1 Tax=Photobacterium sp. TaxID=660 RepID=UPI00299F0CCB|nr:RHS repeat-associated core domain-containing protein [Photobacterium sp.]MDX1303034.1 RHS repeat-associated core domain-containing protein [Photobacterium sp.]